jgi:hypothetical protein
MNTYIRRGVLHRCRSPCPDFAGKPSSKHMGLFGNIFFRIVEFVCDSITIVFADTLLVAPHTTA